jgi:hypothetical protein
MRRSALRTSDSPLKKASIPRFQGCFEGMTFTWVDFVANCPRSCWPAQWRSDSLRVGTGTDREMATQPRLTSLHQSPSRARAPLGDKPFKLGLLVSPTQYTKLRSPWTKSTLSRLLRYRGPYKGCSGGQNCTLRQAVPASHVQVNIRHAWFAKGRGGPRFAS